MTTSLFADLRLRFTELEQEFLNFPNLDSPIAANQDKIRAFVLLIHSELEAYFELLATKIKDTLVAGVVAANAYATLPTDMFVFPHRQIDSEKEYDYARRGERVLKCYEGQVAKNNGIKERNVLGLLLPLGVEYNTITLVLLNTLSTYGERRGLFAHAGSKSCAAILMDRDDEVLKCQQLLSMIEVLDDTLQARRAIP